ncbi:MAG TPA: hypothetical protein VG708_08400 [Mycobacteriales bacterium]|nr:hypothetical protein [Mycobacteriales bacterium]
MSEDLHDDPWRHALCQEQGGGGVPGVVQPGGADAGVAQQVAPGAVVVARVDGGAGRGGEDEAAVVPH